MQRWDHLEYLFSGWAVSTRARDMLAEGGTGLLVDLCGRDRDKLDTPVVIEAWQRGDATASRLMDDVIDTLARGLCNVVAMLNPDTIVIGGGMAQAGEPFFRAVGEAVLRHVFAPFADNFTIKPAKLGESAVPVGALLLAARAV